MTRRGRTIVGTAVFLAATFLAAVPARADLPVSCTNFTDSPLVAGTLIKAVHLTQLRTCVNALRAERALGPASWTDATIVTQVTVVKAVHITELRAAVNAVYASYGQTSPTYIAAPIAGVTTIATPYFTEIRSAIATAGLCSVTLTPSAYAGIAPATGATGTFTVTSNCAWQATSSAAWLAVSPSSGSAGSQTAQFSVAANTSGQRSGSITVQGVSLSITQAAGATPNLVANGDFELGFAGCEDLTGCQGVTATSWEPIYDPAAEDPVRFSVGGEAGDYAQAIEHNGGLRQWVTVPPHVAYLLTADVFVQGGASMWIHRQGVEVTHVGARRLGAQRLQFVFSHDGPAPESLVIQIFASDAEIDHVVLRPLADVSAEERVQQGAFEGAFLPIDPNDPNGSGEVGSGWTHSGQSTPPQGWFSKGGFPDGAQGRQNFWQTIEGGSFGTGIHQSVMLEATQRYLVHADVKVDGGGGAKLAIGPSGGVDVQQVYVCGPGEWHELATLFTPPFTGEYTISIASHWPQTNYHVDDVSVAPTTLEYVKASSSGAGTLCVQQVDLTFFVGDAVSQLPVEGATVEITPNFGSGPPRQTNSQGFTSVFHVGLGSLAYTITKSGYQAAVGTINVTGGSTFAVALSNGPPSGCSVSLSPSSVVLPLNATPNSVAVFAPSNCAWSAVSTDESFLTITSAASGVGNGIVAYQVADNYEIDNERTAHIVVNGAVHTVTQRSLPPNLLGIGVDANVWFDQASNTLNWYGETTNAFPVYGNYIDGGCECELYWESRVGVDLELTAPDGSKTTYWGAGTPWARYPDPPFVAAFNGPAAGQWTLTHRHRQFVDRWVVIRDPEDPEEYDLEPWNTTVEFDYGNSKAAVVTPIGSRLTLFLDVDGNFNPSSPSSDHSTFIPGTNPATGLSVALPQTVTMIAAWVGPNNQIVAPPTNGAATFAIPQTSRFKGYAMNAGESTDPDYELVNPTAVAFSGSDHTARVEMKVHDYGGFARVTVAVAGTPTAQLILPEDLDGNWLPDRGWKATANNTIIGDVPDSGGMAFRDSDGDPTPAGIGRAGDGLTAFEEYRGFMVRGEHRRTDTAYKDVFIDSDLPSDIGYAVNLPVTKHWVRPEELSLVSPLKVINTNFANGGVGGNIPAHADQHGIVVRDLFIGPTGNFGDAVCNIPCTPNTPWDNGSEPEVAEIYTSTIRQVAPNDDAGERGVRKATGHEIGHKIGVRHFCWDSAPSLFCPNPSERRTTMISAFNWANPTWTNIPSTYDQVDVAQIKVKGQ